MLETHEAQEKINSSDELKQWSQGLNIAELLIQLGEDLQREGLEETPKRVRKAWLELLEGYTMDPEAILEKTFQTEGDGLQICRGIHYTSMCEHHLLPFVGHVHIGYVPEQHVVGLSKLARLVDCFAKRLQIQERLAQQICDALELAISPRGIMVVVTGTHFCCTGRGVKRNGMDFVTSATAGKIDSSLFSTLLGG